MRGHLEKIFAYQKIKTFKEPALVNAGRFFVWKATAACPWKSYNYKPPIYTVLQGHRKVSFLFV